jgi:fucose permease
VGAQVTIGAFFINYCAEEGVSDARASQLLSYALIVSRSALPSPLPLLSY